MDFLMLYSVHIAPTNPLFSISDSGILPIIEEQHHFFSCKGNQIHISHRLWTNYISDSIELHGRIRKYPD